MLNPVIQDGTVPEQLALFRRELEQELASILSYWIDHTRDEQYGGFYGSIDHHNVPDILAPKGSVLHSRILYTFAAAYNFTRKQSYLTIATRAYQYICHHFLDAQLGGVYWTVDHSGHPFDTKKQIYAQAFVLHGLAEYYKATRDSHVKELAVRFYNLLEHFSYDRIREGYLEVFTAEWEEPADLCLHSGDPQEKKSANTHLIILEAYINLFSIWPDDNLRRQINRLVSNFLDHIIITGSWHIKQFFDEHWQTKSTNISFGQNISASWLLSEAADIVSDRVMTIRAKKVSLNLAHAALKAIDSDGGMWYEYDTATGLWVKEKHWWPQAEAMIGFFHAWQAGGDESFLRQSLKSWQFICRFIIDKEQGEWRWGVLHDTADDHTTIMSWEDKAGLWKCPYYNGRACMELIRRIDRITLG